MFIRCSLDFQSVFMRFSLPRSNTIEMCLGSWLRLAVRIRMHKGGTKEALRRHQGSTTEAPRRHRGGTREAPWRAQRRHQGGTTGAPRRHHGGTREAPGRHQGGTEAGTKHNGKNVVVHGSGSRFGFAMVQQQLRLLATSVAYHLVQSRLQPLSLCICRVASLVP